MKQIWILLVLAGICCAGCATTLKDYVPLSPEEAKVKNVIVKMERCWNAGDAGCVAALYTQDAEVMVGGGSKGRMMPVGTAPEGTLSRVMEKLGRKSFRIEKMEFPAGDGEKCHVIGWVDLEKFHTIGLVQHFFLVRLENGGWLIQKQFHGSYTLGAAPPYVDRGR